MTCRGLVILILGSVALRAAAQEVDVAAPYTEAVRQYEQGLVSEAAEILDALIEQHDANAAATIGPAFGNIWFHRGLCYLDQGDLAEAARAFRQCYVTYPNPPDSEEALNSFHTLALVKWGDTENQRKRFDAAIKLYARALKDTDDDNLRHQVLMNLAICLFETGDLDRSDRICRKVVQTESAPQPLQRLAVLQGCRVALERSDVDAARKWLRSMDALEKAPTLERAGWTSLLLQAGRKCGFLDEQGLALQLYSLAPDTDEAAVAIEQDRLWARAGIRPATRQAAPPPGEVVLARADAWYLLEAYRLALPGYERALTRVPHERAAAVLHAASISAAMIDLPDRSESHLRNLLEDHADYPLVSEVGSAWIESLLRGSRDAEALTHARDLRDRWEPGDRSREPLDYLAATAAYRLREFAAADQEFADYLAHFTVSERRDEALYYRALSKLHGRQWEPAVPLLDTLLTEFPTTPFIDGALYYRAFCNSALTYRKDARSDLERLLNDFPVSPHRPAAMNLLGDLHFHDREWDRAEWLYSEAQHTGDLDIAAYATYQRIRIHLARHQPDAAVALYEAFRHSYRNSDYLPKASAAVVAAYEQLNRAEEAIALLTEDILERAPYPREPGMQVLMEAHHALYKRTHGYQALADRLRDFPGPSPSPPPLQAWLLLGRIETLESLGGKDHREQIDDLYRQLIVNYELDDLDAIFLLKMARWLHDSGDDAAAISHYTALTSLRGDSAYLQPARIERATLLRDQGDPDSIQRARDELERVLVDTQAPDILERATLELARTLTLAEAWTEALEQWEQYIANNQWFLARAEATYHLALCHDRLDARAEAFSQYVNTYVHFEGQVDWSARAFVRSALMAREDGDPTRAMGILDDMMSRMGHLSHPIVNKARTLQLQWKEHPPEAGT